MNYASGSYDLLGADEENGQHGPLQGRLVNGDAEGTNAVAWKFEVRDKCKLFDGERHVATIDEEGIARPLGSRDRILFRVVKSKS